MSRATAFRHVCSNGSLTFLAHRQVKEEAPGLGEDAGEQKAPGEPLTPLREAGAFEIDEVDEGKDKQHSRMSVARPEECPLKVCEPVTLVEETQQRVPTVLDGDK